MTRNRNGSRPDRSARVVNHSHRPLPAECSSVAVFQVGARKNKASMGRKLEFDQPLCHEATETSSTKAKTILD